MHVLNGEKSPKILLDPASALPMSITIFLWPSNNLSNPAETLAINQIFHIPIKELHCVFKFSDVARTIMQSIKSFQRKFSRMYSIKKC